MNRIIKIGMDVHSTNYRKFDTPKSHKALRALFF